MKCGGSNGGPADPVGGDAPCDSFDEKSSFRNCYPKCNAGTDFSVAVPNFYTCGPRGSFNVHNPYLSFAYPACSGEYFMMFLQGFIYI